MRLDTRRGGVARALYYSHGPSPLVVDVRLARLSFARTVRIRKSGGVLAYVLNNGLEGGRRSMVGSIGARPGVPGAWL